MIIIFYKWRIKEAKENQFISSWSEITKDLLDNFSSLGSRLHLGNDGFYCGYAQWNSLEDRKLAFQTRSETESNILMKEAIEESFPEIIFEPLKDYLKL